ncbi:MAG TPA: RNA polymerase sigma factor [Streptosporangiaceae bacterium]|nr:RNA polymerase sigma factor [Streptosporangiaceae bacterium]
MVPPIFMLDHDLRVDRTPPRTVPRSPSTVTTTAPSARAGPGRLWNKPSDLTAAIRDAREGDGDAFRILYTDIQPRLMRYLWALVGPDAEDVASETWLHVARDLRSFHGDSDGFRGWVATIARHRATDHLRSLRRRPQPAALRVEDLTTWAARDNTEDRALEAVSTDAAIALIATLPADQAEAVLLRVVVGLDATQAARVLGKRPGAVRTASYRGLRRLASALGEGESQ